MIRFELQTHKPFMILVHIGVTTPPQPTGHSNDHRKRCVYCLIATEDRGSLQYVDTENFQWLKSRLFATYCKFPKMWSSFCTTKVGRGRLLKSFVCLVHMPPPSVPHSLEYVWTRQSRWLPQLWERTAAALNMYYGKPVALALRPTRMQRSNLHYLWKQGMTLRKLMFPVQATTKLQETWRQ